MRVLVIDDSAVMRKALTSIIGSDSTFEVVGFARNGQEGLDRIAQLKPDLVTLDIEMPIMDGLSALAKIAAMPEPRPMVLMCSTLTAEGSHAALKALRLGAADIIEKDPEALGAREGPATRQLLGKLRALRDTLRYRSPKGAGASRVSPSGPAGPAVAAAPAPPAIRVTTHPPVLRAQDVDLVVIGSSTGGPPVLERILSELPASMPMPIIVAQHMPRLFTKSIAERLNDMCRLKVIHAETEVPLLAGTVYVTPGGLHSRVHKAAAGRFRLEISERPTDAIYKPSVHELFMSAAKTCLSRAVGVMLTGMGDDGCQGARAMFAAGATVLAQSPETCVVYGMPRAVVESNAASAVLTPEDITLALSTLANPAVAAA